MSTTDATARSIASIIEIERTIIDELKAHDDYPAAIAHLTELMANGDRVPSEVLTYASEERDRISRELSSDTWQGGERP